MTLSISNSCPRGSDSNLGTERSLLPNHALVARVTVVMAVYNAAPFLREAVDSILSQTFRNFELIAVDDLSSDDSLSILESFNDPRMRVIRHQINKGAAVSRNDAILQARGDLIAIMDADDVCEPTRLEEQVAFLDCHPLVGLVGCGSYDNIDTNGIVLHRTHLPLENEEIQRTIMKRWCFLHSSLMFRRKLHETVGGYRQEFEPVEDHEFVLRVVEHTNAHNLGERLVSYRINPRSLSVVGYQRVERLREEAIRLARLRRSGEEEALHDEMVQLSSLNIVSNPAGFRLRQKWLESWYAAGRYYGFGCREICADRFHSARRCFLQSLCTNVLFAKSWIAIAVSLVPGIAKRLKSMFRSSMELQKIEFNWIARKP